MELPLCSTFLLGILILQIQKAFSLDPEIINNITEVKIVSTTQNPAIFNCTVKNQGSHTVKWSLLNPTVTQKDISKNGNIIVSNNPETDYGKKYDIKVYNGGDNTKVYELTIQDVKFEDAGGYMCSVKIESSNNYPKKLGTLKVVEECTSDLFECKSDYMPGRKCISKNWRCDGDPFCPDGDDEPSVNGSCPAITCGQKLFPCGSRCISMAKVCDGNNDCTDGSDEKAAACINKTKPTHQKSGAKAVFHCPPNTYQCPSSRKCIPIEKLCDGNVDCPLIYSADEGTACRNTHCQGINCSQASGCKESPDGPMCYCPAGQTYYAFNGTCININECDYEGYCDQNCYYAANATCSCDKRGYTLDSDGKSCKHSTGQDPLIIFTNNDMISILNISTGSIRNINATRTSAFDFDYNNKTICWISEAAAELRCASVDKKYAPHWAIKPKYSLVGVEQMAKDWFSGNWYFTGGERGIIFVCTSSGAFCSTLLLFNNTNPRGIALVPHDGYMFITEITKHAQHPRVSRANMDGSGYVVLLENKIVRPIGITVDYVNQKIYFVDAQLNFIQRMNYDGSNLVEIMKDNIMRSAVGISVFESFLYVTNPQKKKIYKIHRFDSSRNSIIAQNLTRPEAIHVYHKLRQPDFENLIAHPCGSNNGQCQQICVPEKKETQWVPKCLCQPGSVSPPTVPFLLYTSTRQRAIKGLSLDGTSELMFPIQNVEHPVAIDFWYEKQEIYYTDSIRGTIGRRNLDETNGDETDFITSGCESMAIDWMGKNIFWTSELRKTINVAKLLNKNVQKVLVDMSSEHILPKAIVVDPGKGYMYWTNWAAPHFTTETTIEYAYMNGTHRRTFVKGLLQSPDGLTIDHEHRRLYWTDNFYDRIEYKELDGTKNRIVVVHGVNMTDPYGIAYSNNVVYWAEGNGMLMSHNETSNETVVLLSSNSGSLGLKLYAPQIGSNNCSKNNGGCSDLCLNTPYGIVCQCGDGRNKTNNKCVGANSDCSDNEFKCTSNGRCISNLLICDGDQDCEDNSDEDKDGVCKNYQCNHDDDALVYTCSNYRCIRSSWLCDGEDDCRNGDDEDPKHCMMKSLNKLIYHLHEVSIHTFNLPDN